MKSALHPHVAAHAEQPEPYREIPEYDKQIHCDNRTESARIKLEKIDEIQISPVSAVVDFYTLSDVRADFAHAVLNLKSGIQIES